MEKKTAKTRGKPQIRGLRFPRAFFKNEKTNLAIRQVMQPLGAATRTSQRKNWLYSIATSRHLHMICHDEVHEK